jgi:hypothetical protein
MDRFGGLRPLAIIHTAAPAPTTMQSAPAGRRVAGRKRVNSLKEPAFFAVLTACTSPKLLEAGETASRNARAAGRT